MCSPRSILAISTLALFATVALFGLSVSMKTDSHGNMATCPFMQGATSICRMNIMEHLQAWQSTFVATLPAMAALFLAIAFLLVFHPAFEGADSSGTERFYNKRRDSLITIPNYLRMALSKGILHGKIYDFSFIVG